MSTNSKPLKIEKEKLLLVEGQDAYYFSIWACRAYNLPDVQVVNFGGVDELGDAVAYHVVRPDFEKVQSLAIVRDVETDPAQAIRSVQTALRKAGLEVPATPFLWTDGHPRTAFGLFPGSTEQAEDGTDSYKLGALEHLLLDTVDEQDLLQEIDRFLDTADARDPLTHRHKSRLHAYLSVKNDYVGMKIGEAAQANAWNWEHPSLEKFKQLMKTL